MFLQHKLPQPRLYEYNLGINWSHSLHKFNHIWSSDQQININYHTVLVTLRITRLLYCCWNNFIFNQKYIFYPFKSLKIVIFFKEIGKRKKLKLPCPCSPCNVFNDFLIFYDFPTGYLKNLMYICPCAHLIKTEYS